MMGYNLISVGFLLIIIQAISLLIPKKQNIPKQFIDLRSDTVTKPSNAMRKVMFEAEVGDDVFGEDPTINKLESRVANMFGKDSSLFFPTGTMSNLAATMSWCNSRGSEVILGDSSHMYLFEQSNIAQIAGVSPRVIANKPDGTLDLNSIESAIRAENIHFPITELIALENTHNYCGGRILPSAYTEALCNLAKIHNVPVHLDGARIWNAASASGQKLSSLVESIDSISVCLSKGLGAPAGSMLIGSNAFIKRARRIRKALGGGMRQAGILAAAGLQAIDDFESGILENDHKIAKLLADQLANLPGLFVDTNAVDTNIILVHLEDKSWFDPCIFATKLKDRGVLVLPFGPRSIRVVVHRDISMDDIPGVVSAFRDVTAQEWAKQDLIIADTDSRVYTFSQVDDSELYEENNGGDNSFDESNETGLVLINNNNMQQDDLDLSLAFSYSSSITTTISSASTESILIQENNEINKSSYEEVRIMGMTVSQEGFCVLLQGLISDRILKVLVTPEDPMADGLDRDEVETSEAVTLLQLLQDIDVETYLAKDTLEMKFNGDDSKHKYILQQVTIDEVDPSKGFQGKFAAIQKRVDNTEHNLPIAIINAQTTADIVSYDGIIDTSSQDQINTINILTSGNIDNNPSSLSSSSTNNQINNTEVKASSSFFAIALALRHHAAIEVKSDLLYNQNLSYTLDELKTDFPKMVECSSSFIPKIETRGEKYLIERYKKRLIEAIRQRKDDKIKQLEQLLLMYDPETIKLKSFAFKAIHNDPTNV